MSKLETNQVDPATGTTLTLGTSGDTISIPSGVTIANSGTATGFGGTNTPSFYVVRSSNQTISSASTTKIQFDTEIFDTAGAYDNSTNYRFTVPSGQAGKYYFFTKLNFETTSGDDIIFVSGGFYKNGAIQNWGITNTSGGTTETFRQYLYNNSIMLDLSVGDYVEVYGNAIGSNLALESNGSGYYETAFGGYKIIE